MLQLLSGPGEDPGKQLIVVPAQPAVQLVSDGHHKGQQNDLQELQARLENELASETAKFNEALRDSLQNFLKDYNKDKNYDLILSKAGDNILLGGKKFDITQDVINGLNKRYKPAAKPAAEEKKEEKK